MHYLHELELLLGIRSEAYLAELGQLLLCVLGIIDIVLRYDLISCFFCWPLGLVVSPITILRIFLYIIDFV